MEHGIDMLHMATQDKGRNEKFLYNIGRKLLTVEPLIIFIWKRFNEKIILHIIK